MRMKDYIIKSILRVWVLLLCCHFCTGMEHPRCNRTYEKIGCFMKYSRKLFHTLVMTDRDWTASQYGGQDIDWFNWAEYIHGFSCRCYERLLQLGKEQKKKYHHFSLSNYGECWTSEDIIYDLTQLDYDEEACIGKDFLSCDLYSDDECFGIEFSQFVYHVHYDDEPFMDEFEILNSECKIETMTVCTASSTSYTTSTVSP